uniref:RING-type domain-containing protein n=1 Tax=Panagrolaimus davidi TaxID=227884 RepID=A0A914QLC0_9BILA
MASSRNLVLRVHCLNLVESYNIETKQKNHQEFPDFDGNITNFFTRLRLKCDLKHVKAIAFTFVGGEFSNFVGFYTFRLKCRDFCEKHQIFCLLLNSTLFQPFSLISQTKTMVNEGEKVMVFLLDFPFPKPPLSFIRQKKNYRFINKVRSKFSLFTQQWQEDMFQGLNPKKIIFSNGSTKRRGLSDLEKAQEFFESYNPIVVDFEDGMAHIMETIVNKVLHLMDEKDDPFGVDVPCWGKFEIRYNGEILIKAGETEIAPFEKSVIVKVVPKKSVSMYGTYPTVPELVEEIKLSKFKTKKVKVTLKLDINSFYDFKVEPFNAKEEEAMANVAVKSKLIKIVENIHLLDEKYMKPSDSESDSEQFVCIDPKEKEDKISADKKNEVFDIKNKPSLLSDSDEEGGENSAESYKSGYDKSVAQKDVEIVEEDFLNRIGDSNVASKNDISVLDGDDFLDEVAENKSSTKAAVPVIGDEIVNVRQRIIEMNLHETIKDRKFMKGKCFDCAKAPATIILLHCCHLVFCKQCFPKNPKCLLCGKKYQDFIDVYA